MTKTMAAPNSKLTLCAGFMSSPRIFKNYIVLLF